KDAKYAEVVSRLPVSAWNGTLHDRYTRTESEAGAGLVHAKTGSLTGVSSLAGELRTVGGHRLVFAVTTNGDFPEGPVGAKTAV
ncbi:D-alanyl-D-alanine carboxypeptidase/D-alanyl-D-alanine-endopeptidase, partial [Xanthomonas citri pv. citri]|nr:D-alanyl-D-alanine carboxypeptidase/D-alanyl-D-alanine-endopeptidase [Xanthomonas citri pv. citri]